MEHNTEHVSSTSGSTAKKRTSSKILDMVVEAVLVNRHVRGTSVPAIKGYIQHNYPETDLSKLNSNVKRALVKGIDEDILVRPKTSEESTGATGRFKVNKEWLSRIDQPKKAKTLDGYAKNIKTGKPLAKSAKTSSKSGKTPAATSTPMHRGATPSKTEKPKTGIAATKAKTSRSAKSKDADVKSVKKKQSPVKTDKKRGKAPGAKGVVKPAKNIKGTMKSLKKTGQIMTPVKKSAKQ